MDLDALATALTGAIGANDAETEPKLWLDSGYAPLNKILSGYYTRGWAGGRIIEIAGPAASGKTLLATLAMIAAQKAGGIAIFIDYERSFNQTFAELLGLNCAFPLFIYKRPETWEEGNTVGLKAAEAVRSKNLIDKDAPIVIVQDSIAAAVPASMLYDKEGKRREISSLTMNDTTAMARVTSTTLKVVNQLVGDFDITAIYLNQMRLKLGVVYGDPRTTPGGGAMEYYASTRIFTGRKLEKEKATGELKAAIVGLQTVKNKLAMPYKEVELRLAYEDGLAKFDFTRGYVEELIDAGKLPKDKSGRITFDGKTYFIAPLVEKIETEGRVPELIKMLTEDISVAA